MQLGVLCSSAFNQNIIQLANLHSNSNRTLFISLLFYYTQLLPSLPQEHIQHLQQGEHDCLPATASVASVNMLRFQPPFTQPPSTHIPPCCVIPSSSHIISCNISHAITVKRPRPPLQTKVLISPTVTAAACYATDRLNK